MQSGHILFSFPFFRLFFFAAAAHINAVGGDFFAFGKLHLAEACFLRAFFFFGYFCFFSRSFPSTGALEVSIEIWILLELDPKLSIKFSKKKLNQRSKSYN